MSKTLARLLNKTEEDISRLVGKLEGLTGYPAEDVRLLTELRAKSSAQILSLGLDPSDTTNRELHLALSLRAQKDDELFSKALGIQRVTETGKLSRLLISVVASLGKDVWCLKKSLAKDLLRQNPPKRLMKSLGYRSAESMLKREDINEIYAALPFVESSRWLDSFWRKHTKFTPADFETRKLEFVVMPGDRWSDVTRRSGIVTCMLPLGSAAVWPLPDKMPHKNLSLSVMLAQAVEVMTIYSASLKLEQMSPSFAAKVVEFMQPRLASPINIEGATIHWDILHRHYGRQHADDLPLFFDPHLSPSELHIKTVAEQLSAIHPTFNWWAKNDFNASVTAGQPLSLNLSDMIAASLANSFSLHNFQKSLWNELIMRYMKFSGVANYMSSQLDKHEKEPETVSISTKNNGKSPQELILAEFA